MELAQGIVLPSRELDRPFAVWVGGSGELSVLTMPPEDATGACCALQLGLRDCAHGAAFQLNA